MIAYPDASALLAPQVHTLAGGRQVHLFHSASTDLLKIDLIFPAGYMYQPQMLAAAAAAKLMVVATRSRDAQRLSEYLDARGVVVECSAGLRTSTLTVYTHRRYADEVVPLVREMVVEAAFGEGDFEVYRSARRQELAVMERRTSSVARRLWHEALFGPFHPLGRMAGTVDADRLSLPVVKAFFDRHYRMDECRIVLSGCTDDHLLSLFDGPQGDLPTLGILPPAASTPACLRRSASLEGAQQSSLRIGRRLPDGLPLQEQAVLAVCTTLLGGYFGSRLMSNLREDKGYTYGVNAYMQPYAGCQLFYVLADVASDVAEEAEEEVMNELRCLADEPPSDEELDMVKSTLSGDTMRMLDGVFERSDRYCSLVDSGSMVIFDARFGQMLNGITSEQVSAMAHGLLAPEQMLSCRVGV